MTENRIGVLERREWQAHRDYIRHTLLDADLSEVWLRAKVQQLLEQADDLDRALWEATSNEALAEIERLKEAMRTAREQIRQGHAMDWAVDTLLDALGVHKRGKGS